MLQLLHPIILKFYPTTSGKTNLHGYEREEHRKVKTHACHFLNVVVKVMDSFLHRSSTTPVCQNAPLLPPLCEQHPRRMFASVVPTYNHIDFFLIQHYPFVISICTYEACVKRIQKAHTKRGTLKLVIEATSWVAQALLAFAAPID